MLRNINYYHARIIHIPDIRSLGFQLGARTLRIDASDVALPLALEAIRKAGFDPKPLQAAAGALGDEDTHGDEHDHEHGFSGGVSRLVAALVLAIGAESHSYFAPQDMGWKIGGMAIAAIAIWLAGIDTYKKGMGALIHGKLNINALMAVAVTGAFLIGQWPEAAMVMALYAIAELVEAKAVDRARNSIKGLLEMAPEEALMFSADGSWLMTPVTSVPLGLTAGRYGVRCKRVG